ncbi:unnamed protein product [Mytilus edulis]|uniref:Uncharacterized protein n=1 Tax=Mytilus edulis TaxID=6550 RepID=A0A8S3QEN2_MYTED|nr:unnamed protein product [Mytilus edulis]
MRGYEELVDLFISVGADVDAQNGWFSPLTAACREGHLRTVEMLLHRGSNINQTNKNGETPIHTACFGGHYSLVKLLIEKHADINKRDKYYRTPLYVCCLSGHESIAQLLIDEGAKVGESSDSLIVAIHGGHVKIVEQFISKDFPLDSVDIKNLETPLHKSCRKGSVDVILTLLDNGADTKQTNKDRHTPVFLAKTEGKIVNESILKALGEMK